jgi:threonine-phosphate decarboxylase
VERKHGGDIYQVVRESGISPEDIIDFSANINPLGYSARVKKSFAEIESLVTNYPDRKAGDFIDALSVHHNFPGDNFLAGSGATEFVHFFPTIIRPKSVLVVAPTFTEYEYSYQRAKGVIFYFNTAEKDNFVLQKKQLLDELKRSYSALYICNPANPTGALVPAETMEEIVSYACRKGTNVIIDETYMDIVEKHSMKKLTKNFDNFFILRSMSNFFALPGLRSGYLISHAKNIEKIREKQMPWTMNAVAQRAAVESLDDNAYIQKSIKYITESRSALFAELKTISSLAVFKSNVNYLLLKIQSSSRINALELSEKLLAKGLLIRTCEDFQGLDEMFFRVAVKKKNENKKLVTELKKILAK